MTLPAIIARRRARRPNRVLRVEPLEVRLALSASSIFPDGLNDPDPMVRAAITGVTTSAPADQFAFIVDPAPASAPLGQGDLPSQSLANAGPLIGLPSIRNDPLFAGIDGSGYSVVILDTGIDLDHPFFGPDADGNGVADRIVHTANFINPGQSVNDVNGHGTHVSSIIASSDAQYTGVAPGANIILLKVLNELGLGSAAAIESALQWVVANADAFNVAAVNMSLTFGDNNTSSTTRPDLGLTDELAALEAEGVIVASSSGNSFFSFASAQGVAYPSADPSSLSIGATWSVDAGGPHQWNGGAQDFTSGVDRVVSFSQRHETLTSIFAPGGAITAAGVGGGVVTLSGTSMASPFVAGAAVLAQQLAIQNSGARLSLAEISALLKQTGVPIFDGDNEDDNVTNTQLEFRRLDIYALMNAIDTGGLSDLSLPSGLALDGPAPAGGQTRVNFTIANQGASDSGDFTSRFYLSTDLIIDNSDIPLSAFTDSVAAGKTVVHKGVAVQLPAATPPGAYFIGIVLDDDDAVTEGNEANNVFIVPVTISDEGPEIWLVDAASGNKIASSESQLDFGLVEQGSLDASRTIRLTNDGSTPLLLTNLALPAGFEARGFPSQVQPLETIEFTISLVAAGPLGPYSGVASFNTNDGDENPFELSLAGVIVEPDDYGDDAGSAALIAVPTVRQGEILPPEDVDWFQFAAVEGMPYTFETFLGTLHDSVLRLIDVDGTTVLVTDDDGGVGLASRIEWTAPANGVYFVEVASKAGAFGSYQLVVRDDDDHGDDAQSATPVTIPLATDGDIQEPGDADWFQLDAIANVEYRIEVDLGTLSGVQVRVYGPDGTTQLAIGYGSPEVPAAVSFSATQSAAYFVEVTGFEFTPDPPPTNDPPGVGVVVPPDGPTGSYQVTSAAISALPGDYDGDADVDGSDFLVWQRSLGSDGAAVKKAFDSRGFENYRVAPLDGQHQWTQLGPVDGSAVVQNVVAADGARGVRVDRASGSDNWWGVPLGANAPTGPAVLVTWDMRVTATGAENGGLGPFFGVQAYDDHLEVLGLLGSFGVDATTLDVIYQREGDGVIVESGLKVSPDMWYSYALLFDFDAHQFTAYFDGQPLVTEEFVDLHVDGVNLDRLTDADLIALAAQDTSTSQLMPGTAYFDNFRIVSGALIDLFPADGNGDGVVDGLDLDLWKANFGVSYAAPDAGVQAAAASPVQVSQSFVAAENQAIEIATDVIASSASSSVLSSSFESFLPLAQRVANSDYVASAARKRDRLASDRTAVERAATDGRDYALRAWPLAAQRLTSNVNFRTHEADCSDDDSAEGAEDLGEVDAALAELFA